MEVYSKDASDQTNKTLRDLMARNPTHEKGQLSMSVGSGTPPNYDLTLLGSDDNFDNIDSDDDDKPDDWRPGGTTSAAAAASAPGYSAPRLPSATSQADYIKAMYAANRQAEEANLRSAYESNLASLQREEAMLPGRYDTAANQTAAQAEINRANFNEYAAANGLNTGAGSQARLAQNNALLGNISAIRKAQADAQSELAFQRTQLESQYKNAIAAALAKNNMAQAQALYDEARRVDESMVSTAINQANLDWSVWSRLYR